MGERVARRRSYQPGGRPIRLSVTLTAEEHRQLAELAAHRGVSIATLLVEAALHPHPGSQSSSSGESRSR